jgi:exopolyphosphatase/guanosine-5'-triphosphate,3'-diphosphate pyrophosphatase
MAELSPPDGKRRAGKKRGDKSGKVADFRYKRPSRPDEKKQSRQGKARARNRRRNPNAQSDSRPHGKQPSAQAVARKAPAIVQANKARRGQAFAALDLGTNNCRLLIARPTGENFTVIDAFSRVVKLGEGLTQSGELSQEAMDRTLAALTICADKLRRRNVVLAHSVATEACRRASNGAEFIERVRRETGIALNIISAEEEARLAMLGCHILLEPGDGPAIIFDIGGGSTELVLLEPGEQIPRIIDWQSVPWGVVSVTDTIGKCDGNEAERKEKYARMRSIVSESFAPFAERIAKSRDLGDLRLLGTSGTVTTLASLHLELPHYDRKAVDGLIVPASSMREISARLANMSLEERRGLPCIGQDRADLVVAGCAILESILDIWPASRLGVADRGIREGILRNLMSDQLSPQSQPDARPADHRNGKGK